MKRIRSNNHLYFTPRVYEDKYGKILNVRKNKRKGEEKAAKKTAKKAKKVESEDDDSSEEDE